MRIILMHNPKAGSGKHSKRDLMAAPAKAGHHAIYQTTKKSDHKKALKKSTDLVLVAGGDGTIGKVGRELIDTGIPLSVLPLGTANILWEAMNIRSIGPVLYLSSQAATKDGRLDFVCAREEDRSLLMEYLDARLEGAKVKFPLPLRRFRRLKILWKDSALHFDSKVWPRKDQKAKSQKEIEMTVKPSALVILQPEPAAKDRSDCRSQSMAAGGCGCKPPRRFWREIPDESRYKTETAQDSHWQ